MSSNSGKDRVIKRDQSCFLIVFGAGYLGLPHIATHMRRQGMSPLSALLINLGGCMKKLFRKILTRLFGGGQCRHCKHFDDCPVYSWIPPSDVIACMRYE